MKIFALGDLHLPGAENKTMGIFGDNWMNHPDKIKEKWIGKVRNEDLVLIPGDLSWAFTQNHVMNDLEWLESLPGKKILIRGNHDYWWKSISQVRKILPPSVSAIQNDSLLAGDTAFAGTRLWDVPGVDYFSNIKWVPREELGIPPEKSTPEDSERIYHREIERLNLSLESVSGKAKRIIVLLHYPPIDPRMKDNEVLMTLQKFAVDICVFGHLHSLVPSSLPQFPLEKWGIKFYLTSADFLDFDPLLVAEV